MATALRILAVLCVLATGTAYADRDFDEGHGKSDDIGHRGRHGGAGGGFGAPEPLTMIGLAAGASAIGAAAWRKRRNR